MLDSVFKLFSYAMAFLNTCYLRVFLSKIGSGSMIFSHSRVLGPSKISIGSRCILLPNSRIEVVSHSDVGLVIGDRFQAGNNLFISCAGSIKIGNGVLLSDNVAVIDNTHVHEDLMVSTMEQGIRVSTVVIEDNVTIYRNSTILAGVVVGEGAIVGAHSLVKTDVPPYTIVAGVPAKIVGHRQ